MAAGAARRPVAGAYPLNVVRNQKYTVLTLVPRVLLNEFAYFFNLYFLVVALSQLVPALRVGARNPRAQPRPLPQVQSRCGTSDQRVGGVQGTCSHTLHRWRLCSQ
jgi:hypothetical protein